MNVYHQNMQKSGEGGFLYKLINRFFFKVADRHAPKSTKHCLNRKKLYIYPSIRGHAFIFVMVIIWLLGTNYQNNLIIGLCFLLCSIFVISILETHSNLSGLSLEYVGTVPAFAGDNVEFIFTLNATNEKFVENVEIGWQAADDSVVNIVVAPGEPLKVSIPQKALKRGWHFPGRLLVQSYYPFGLLRCWSWLNWHAAALVYPEPLESPQQDNLSVISSGDGSHPVRGGEDYSGLREYHAGDSLKHVDWKHYAQEKGLYVKEFSQNVSRERWLSYNDFRFYDIERRLCALCYWAIKFSNQDEYFGVELPGKIIPPDKGENHRRKVLEALAMFEANPS